MLFGNRDAKIIRIRTMNLIILLPVLIAVVAAISACSAPKGSIVILENPKGRGFTADFKEWNANNKCELSLNRGDVLQIEVAREAGEIALAVSGKKGSEPYTGNDLKPGVFTVTVSETDDYLIRITGKDATGKVAVKRI